MKASFRDYVNTLRKNDELLEISKPVDLRDIAALVAQSEKALLFKNLSGYSMPLVSGLLQSRNRIALGMGVEYENIADKLGKAMDKPIKPKRVANAPVKEVIHTGKKVNLYDLPVPVFSIMDGGPMITGGVVIAEDPEFGINAGIYRLMLKERNITGIDIVTPNNMRKFAERALAKKKPLPISISIGTHPYELVASTFKANLGVNELTFAGGLRNEALRLADGETVPVPCIADAEIVLEGEILPEGWVHPEGPFCEFNRLMGGMHMNPRVRIKAIMHRKDADVLRAANALGKYLDERADLRSRREACALRSRRTDKRDQRHPGRLLPLAHRRVDQKSSRRRQERDHGAAFYRRHQTRHDRRRRYRCLRSGRRRMGGRHARASRPRCAHCFQCTREAARPVFASAAARQSADDGQDGHRRYDSGEYPGASVTPGSFISIRASLI